MARRQVTLSDIAERCGVSLRVVSAIMNKQSGSVRFSLATVERVQEAARDMGYRPNRSARSLVGGKHESIGVLVADFFRAQPLMLREIMRYMSRYDLSVIIESMPEDGRLPGLIREDQIDGLIVLPHRDFDSSSVTQVELPTVWICEALMESQAVLRNDEEGGMRMALAKLRECGCQQILHVHGAKDTYVDRRNQAFIEQEGSDQRCICLQHRFEDHLSPEIVADVSKRLVDGMNHWPQADGVICSNQEVALLVVEHWREQGLSRSGWPRLISFNDTVSGHFLGGGISSIDFDLEEIGQKAAMFLHGLLECEESHSRELRIAPTWRPRASTGC